jgi:hypothetical protein
MKVNKINKDYIPFIHIYLVHKGKVPMLHRHQDESIGPNKILGVGGKIEPVEEIF